MTNKNNPFALGNPISLSEKVKENSDIIEDIIHGSVDTSLIPLHNPNDEMDGGSPTSRQDDVNIQTNQRITALENEPSNNFESLANDTTLTGSNGKEVVENLDSDLRQEIKIIEDEIVDNIRPLSENNKDRLDILEPRVLDNENNISTNTGNIESIQNNIGEGGVYQTNSSVVQITTSDTYIKPDITKNITNPLILDIDETPANFTKYIVKPNDVNVEIDLVGALIKVGSNDTGTINLKVSSTSSGYVYYQEDLDFDFIGSGSADIISFDERIRFKIDNTRPLNEELFLTFKANNATSIVDVQEKVHLDVVVKKGGSGTGGTIESSNVVDDVSSNPTSGLNVRLKNNEEEINQNKTDIQTLENDQQGKVEKYSVISSTNKTFINDGVVEEIKYNGTDTEYTFTKHNLNLLTIYKGRDLATSANENSFPWDQASAIQGGDKRVIRDMSEDNIQDRFETYNGLTEIFDIDANYNFDRNGVLEDNSVIRKKDSDGEVLFNGEQINETLTLSTPISNYKRVNFILSGRTVPDMNDGESFYVEPELWETGKKEQIIFALFKNIIFSSDHKTITFPIDAYGENVFWKITGHNY